MTDAKVLFNHHSSPSVNEDYSLSETEFINALTEHDKEWEKKLDEVAFDSTEFGERQERERITKKIIDMIDDKIRYQKSVKESSNLKQEKILCEAIIQALTELRLKLQEKK